MRAAEDVLLSTPELRFGRFHCDPGDARWERDNHIGDWPMLAFPGTPVEIQQQDRPAVVATPLCVMLYDPQQAYRRRLVDRRGDHCVFLGVSPTLLEPLLGRPRFGRSSAPLAPRDRLGHLLLVELLRHASAAADETPEIVTEGLYALLEQRVWSSARVEGRHVDGFVQLGWADADVSPFENHLGLGAQWTNAFTSRQDRLGLGLTRAGLSGAPGAGFTENAETAVELFYGFELAPWVRAKPDLQYVRNPGGDAALDDAWIATLRVTFSL